MTSKEFVDKQIKFYNWLQKSGKPFEQSVLNIVAKQTKRIFEDGIKSDESQIKNKNGGFYNTKNGLYVNKDLIKGGGKLGANRGKTGKTKFKNGKPHKTVYVKSYYDFRKKLGRDVSKVNLVLNNDLFSDFANAKVIARAKPNKINPLWYTTSFKRDINIKKRSGLEEKYGKIFNLTKKEKEEFYKTVEFNISKARAEFK